MRSILKYEEQLEAAAITLTLAWTSDAIWWFYRGKQTFPIYESAHDRFVDFFRFDERAHLNNCLIHLCSLFERRADTVNLENLLEQSFIEAAAKSRLNFVLKSVEVPLEKVMILRSNLIAHRKNANGYDEWFKRADLRHDDIAELLKVAAEILNEMRLAANLDEWVPIDGTVEDVRSLLEALADDYCD